jgi:D-alanyl-lipoteichoic acid acyltransferase DltB (MBOAT superfamily)
MLFNSVSFLVYFPLVTLTYFLLPHRARWVQLLLVSCLFYMAFVPAYVLILLAMIGIDYAAGLALEATAGGAKRAVLAVSLVTNVGVLAAFKYAPALWTWLADLTGTGHPPIWVTAVLLPVGLSFHTFQAMAYTIDVYRGVAPAERHLGVYALYVLFYPQLVAGPIERPNQLMPQFRAHHRFEPDRVAHGLTRMLWGLFKKMAIADRIAPFVDAAYSNPATAGRGRLLLATYLFAVQIYCDFSGYTDVALGAARVMGFQLMENFDRPYLAVSVSDFWRRWHRSLSYWFRDYLYIPIGGSRVPPWRWAINILVVFGLSGFWHGAGLAFMTWGLLHGAYLIAERWTATARDRLSAVVGLTGMARQAVGMLVTFHLVCFAWIWFRAGTLGQGWAVVRGLFGGATGPSTVTLDHHALNVTLVLAGFAVAVQVVRRNHRIDHFAASFPIWLRWPALYGLALTILWVGVLGQRTFIYFQF